MPLPLILFIMKRQALDIYDDIPYEMKRYLKNYGWHFNKKMCDFAVSLMKRSNGMKKEKIEPLTKEAVDEILKTHGITLENAVLYDHVYTANMCKADFLGRSVIDELRMAHYIKDVIDDVDADDGSIFVSWYAKMVHSGQPIDWDEMV